MADTVNIFNISKNLIAIQNANCRNISVGVIGVQADTEIPDLSISETYFGKYISTYRQLIKTNKANSVA
jgi:hypothetical protein